MAYLVDLVVGLILVELGLEEERSGYSGCLVDLVIWLIFG